MKRRALRTALLALTISSGNFALAAEPAIVLRGVIEKLDGPIFLMKTRYSAPAKFMLGHSPHVVAAERLSFEGIKPGAIMQVLRRSTGTNSIEELQVFSEASHQLVQDILNSSANVGVVRDLTPVNDGYRISINVGAEEKQIVVPAQTPVIAFVPGEVADMKVGAAVVAADGRKMPDGLVEIDLLVYGRDGAVPKL